MIISSDTQRPLTSYDVRKTEEILHNMAKGIRTKSTASTELGGGKPSLCVKGQEEDEETPVFVATVLPILDVSAEKLDKKKRKRKEPKFEKKKNYIFFKKKK